MDGDGWGNSCRIQGATKMTGKIRMCKKTPEGKYIKPEYINVVYFVRKDNLYYKLFISKGQATAYYKKYYPFAHMDVFIDANNAWKY